MSSIVDVARLLPDVEALRRHSIALAAFDIIREPENAWAREHSFEPLWRPGLEAAVLEGGGDGYFIGFCEQGALLIGFDHESPMSPYAADPMRTWPGVLDEVPDSLSWILSEIPEFLDDDAVLATSCTWRSRSEPSWNTGSGLRFPPSHSDPDGAAVILDELTRFEPGFHVPRLGLAPTGEVAAAVRGVLDLAGPVERFAAVLNPGCDVAAVASQLHAIGYP
ncbi:hypothetical protein AB0E96_19375 [Kitasatospora sp. NPDC036755]|uniref:hypothetical protein n=1 Tax=Kitasatospora sp. NPDC036755 TaxID=3154600 RepID=UPI0033D683CA